MAILERTLTGDFTTILTELDAVVKQSVSATLEGSSDFNFSTGRCAVRVYERHWQWPCYHEPDPAGS